MFQKWLIQAAIAFVLRQLTKWGQSIDWVKIKIDLELRVKQLLPGEMFDDEAVKIAFAVVDLFAGILADAAAIEKIVNLVMAGKMAEALEALKQMIVDKFKFPGAVDTEFVDQVLDCM